MSVEIDHLTVPVGDYEASKRFYAQALAPLGFAVLLDWPDKRRAYLGPKGRPSCLWLVESGAAGSLAVALQAEAREAVDAFHAEAVTAGAATKDAPGVRHERNRDYYAACVLDPDGNTVEVVHRGAASQAQAA